MNYNLEHFSDRLREARIAKNLSQRELSKLAGVPQSHISRIESSQVDLRLSSLMAIANALDLEVTLVPRKAMPAVQSIARQIAGTRSVQPPAIVEEMRHLHDKLRELQVKLPARTELDAAHKAYAALKPLRLDSSALERLREINRILGRDTEQWTTITEAAKKMAALRNHVLHAPSHRQSPSEAKPAYTLDEDDQ